MNWEEPSLGRPAALQTWRYVLGLGGYERHALVSNATAAPPTCLLTCHFSAPGRPLTTHSRMPRHPALLICIMPTALYPRPEPFTGVRPVRICAGYERWRTLANTGQQCWKACWCRSILRGTACAAGKDQRSLKPPAPEGPPIMVCGNSFPLVMGVHSNPLRSRCSCMEGAPSWVTSKAGGRDHWCGRG